MLFQFPQLQERYFDVENGKETTQWKIIFPDLYNEVFKNPLGLEYIKDLALVAEKQSFREEVTLQGMKLLCSLHGSKKEVLITSTRMNNELFLLEQYQFLKLMSPADEFKPFLNDNRYESLKKHVERMMLIPLSKMPTVIQRLTKKYQLYNFFQEHPSFEIIKDGYERKLKTVVTIMNRIRPNLLERLTDFGLGIVAKYSLIRLNLLKFVGLLPSLSHDESGVEVKRLFLEALEFTFLEHRQKVKEKKLNEVLPILYFNILRLVQLLAVLFPAKWVAESLRFGVREMSRRFIAGENIQQVFKTLKTLRSTSGRDATLDQLGELVVSEKEADKYLEQVLQLVDGLSKHYGHGEKNAAGIYRAHVSIKVTALCSDFRPEAADATYKIVAPRLEKILLQAMSKKVFIQVDAEHYRVRDAVFHIFQKVVSSHAELKKYDGLGLVVQAYLRDAAIHLEEIVQFAKKELTAPLGLRLVKGAYWDAETAEAQAHSYDSPQFLNKEETDIYYRQLSIKILSESPRVQLNLASHNVADHCFVESVRENLYPQSLIIEHQCLHMTYEALSVAMGQFNLVVRNYIPVGDLLVGMSYLVRRILENSSQVGILAISRSHKKMNYLMPQVVHQMKMESESLQYDKSIGKLTSHFFNRAPLRLYKPLELTAILEAVNIEKEKLFSNDSQKKWEHYSGNSLKSISPSYPEQSLGFINEATKEELETEINELASSEEAYAWEKAPQMVRSSYLVQAAELMYLKRNELAALIVFESGKSIVEALADVDEAVDFLNFYAREAINLYQRHPQFRSRGVVTVVAPWNFPLAIPVGMSIGALSVGNRVALKSAQHTPLIVEEFVRLLYAVGIPKQVIKHFAGRGSTIGEALISHPLTTQVVFTGSKEVGTYIYQKLSAETYTHNFLHYTSPKRVIVEMGGKNACIITQNADLDEAVSKCLYSTFGHAGQKCSALSRIFVHESVSEKFIDRLALAIKDLRLGASDDLSTYINPVVSQKDQERLRQEVKAACLEANRLGGCVLVDRSLEDCVGFGVGPTFIELPFDSLLESQYFEKELFGPILHVSAFQSTNEAIHMINRGEYALTVGIFAQSQNDIDEIGEQLMVGNIYINRGITGARVAVEPFGGFKMSGTGPKAGGVDYLEAFGVIPHQVKFSIKEIEQESKIETVAAEEMAYQKIASNPSSSLTESEYQEKLALSLGGLLQNFEEIWGGLFLLERRLLEKLQNFRLYPDKRQTRKIPGQINYDDFTLKMKAGVYLSSRSRPTFPLIHGFISALIARTRVHIVCLNQESFQIWKKIQKQFSLNFHQELENVFTLQLMKEDDLTLLVQDELSQFILLDVEENDLSQILSKIHSLPNRGQSLKHLMTEHDLFGRETQELMLKFSLTRSYAINVMRFGAPLE